MQIVLHRNLCSVDLIASAPAQVRFLVNHPQPNTVENVRFHGIFTVILDSKFLDMYLVQNRKLYFKIDILGTIRCNAFTSNGSVGDRRSAVEISQLELDLSYNQTSMRTLSMVCSNWSTCTWNTTDWLQFIVNHLPERHRFEHSI